MLKHKGGHKVGKGTYWNLSESRRIDIEKDGVLPGDDGITYLRMPTGLVVALGPFIGLAFFIVFPLIAIGTFLTVLVVKAVNSVVNLGSKMVYFEWRPTEAYLGGKKKKEKADKEEKAKENDSK
ncbi:MAG: hypothetical protein JSV21_10195 [Nitrospirota bacterium]|nr:MAG: hypothetical protein JSV21_10195 [Nitrospirota bacterium]